MNSSLLNASVVLDAKVEEILKIWEERVRNELPAAFEQSTLSLRDHLPHFLRALAQRMRSDDPARDRKLMEVADLHGEKRAALESYSLDQILIEHRILRQVIFEVLEKTLVLARTERNIILDSIEDGMSHSATRFTELELLKETSARTRAEEVQSELRQEKELRERFVSTLTHDLRTPLSVVKMLCDFLTLKDYSREEIVRMAQKMNNNILRCNKMIQDLLDANRIHAGQSLPLNIEKCDLTRIAETSIRDQAQNLGPRLNLRAPKTVTGFWSPEDLRRVLENLLSNAIKYGDSEGRVTVAIEQNETQAMLSVHNEGQALTEQEKKYIFEPFHRGRTANTSQNEGWGIGLTLVKGVVESHGGSVKIDSANGHGTTFVVVIPNDSRPRAHA